jgi:hypothetical protein
MGEAAQAVDGSTQHGQVVTPDNYAVGLVIGGVGSRKERSQDDPHSFASAESLREAVVTVLAGSGTLSPYLT